MLAGCAGVNLAQVGEADQIAVLSYRICDGYGNDVPRGENANCFDLLLDRLTDDRYFVRYSAASSASSSTVRDGRVYSHLADAYIDAGRGEQLSEALYRAWQRAERSTDECDWMAEFWLDVRRRQYLWEHPDLAEAVGIQPSRPPKRGWPFLATYQEMAVDLRLVLEDDEQSVEFLREIERLLDLSYKGDLKKVPWYVPREAADD